MDTTIPGLLSESNKTSCYLSPNPFNKYHLIVEPKKKCKSLEDMTDDEYQDFYSLIFEVSKKVTKLCKNQNFVLFNYSTGVQMHIIMRKENDFDTNDIYKELTNERERISDAELRKQILELKETFN